MQPYSYFHHQPDRQRNPLAGRAWAIVGGVALALAGTGVAVAAVRAKDTGPDGKRPSPTPKPGPSALSGVYAEGATLGAIKDNAVLQSIQAPVAISMYDINQGDGKTAPTIQSFPTVTRAESLVLRSSNGDMIPLEYLTVAADGQTAWEVDKDALLAAGIAVDMDGDVSATFQGLSPQGRILRLVTDLTGEAAAHAYKTATDLVRDENYLLDEPSGTRDDYVRRVLKKLAPELDWSADPTKLTVGTPAWAAWVGVDLVGQIAYQNFWSQQ
jgi:hypothetical protein